MKARFKALAILALLLSGCARDFNTTNTARYHDAGMRAELGRDYLQAEDYYERALVWAGTERVPPAILSATLYNLGRMKGHACKFDEAQDLLLTSLALEEATSGPDSARISSRFFELARLHYDRRQYAQARPYYDQGIAMVRRLKLEEEDPSAFIEALQDYAATLRQAGELNAAETVSAEAAAWRSRHPEARPRMLIARYSPTCRGGGTTVVQSGRA
jgi:tetratricopeptide (TPR) repeat protein